MRRLALCIVLAGCPSSDEVPSDPPATRDAVATTSAPATTTGETMTAAEPAPSAPASDVAALAASSNALAADLYRGLRARKGNLALSPGSIGLALGMTYLGARDETAKEIRAALHLSLDAAALGRGYAALLGAWRQAASAEPQLELEIANRLFAHQALAIEAPFADLTQRAFGAPVERLDFAAQPEPSRVHINGWVSERTRNRIEDLLPPQSIVADTRLVLVNAVYFKGAWLSPFIESATEPRPFHAPDGEVQVPTMLRVGSYRYAETDDAQLLELPYAGDRIGMTIVLPKKRDGLASIEASLDGDTLKGWFAAGAFQRVSVALPRFKIEPGESVRLRELLEQLGIQRAFQRLDAQFTGISVPKTPEDNLYITEVFHQAFVEVNEKGTEAAAATAVPMARAGGAPPRDEPKQFKADHPFLFVIQDAQIDMTLFIGRVEKP